MDRTMRVRWSRGSVLAFGTQVRGLEPGRNRPIFQGEKNPQHAFLRKVSKAVCPMSHLRHVKEPESVCVGSRNFRSKLPAISRPGSSSFHY